MEPHQALRRALFEKYKGDEALFESGIAAARAVSGKATDAVSTRTVASTLSQVLNNRRRMSPTLAEGLVKAARKRLEGQAPERREARLKYLQAAIDGVRERRETRYLDPKGMLEDCRSAIETAAEFFFFNPQVRPPDGGLREEPLLLSLARRLHLQKDPSDPAVPIQAEPRPRVTICYRTRNEATVFLRDLFLAVTGRDQTMRLPTKLGDDEADAALTRLEEEGLLRVLVVPSGAPGASILFFDPYNPQSLRRKAFHLYYIGLGYTTAQMLPPSLVEKWIDTCLWSIERNEVELTPVPWSEPARAVRTLVQAMTDLGISSLPEGF